MKKIISILLGLIICISGFPQKQKKIYVNKYFQRTSKNSACYYRYIFKDSISPDLFLAKDYKLNDTLYQVGTYKSLKPSIKHGKFVQYYSNGRIKNELHYQDDRLNGMVKSYYENGNIKRIENYKNDSIISKQHFTTNNADTSFNNYFQIPGYKNGGTEGLNNFVRSNIKYPKDALRREIQGKVILQFCINGKGDVVDIKIIKSPNSLLSEEAIRIIKLTQGDWTPGVIDNEPVKVLFTYPLNFLLE